jgi:hypothetical protein
VLGQLVGPAQQLHPVAQPRVPHPVAQVVGGPAVPDDHEAQARPAVAQPVHDGDRVVDLLVRDQPADHAQRRRGAAAGRHGQRGLGGVVHDCDVGGADAQRDQLGPGELRDGDVRAAAVEPRRDPGLDPPADAGQPRPEHDRPLLAVHVVDEHDHPPGHQPAEERQPVLHVDDDVRAVAQQVGHGPQVDPEVAAAAPVPDAGAHLVGRGAVVGGAQHPYVVAAQRQAGRHLLDVPLGTAALGVRRVAPVEDGDPQGGDWHASPRRPGSRHVTAR